MGKADGEEAGDGCGFLDSEYEGHTGQSKQ